MGQFESFSAFLNMGGYAPFVWWSYGLSFSLIAGVVFWSKKQRRQLIAQIQQQEQVKQSRQTQVNSEMRL